MARSKRGSGGPPFVQLMEWFQSSEAWASMKPGPRALYLELKRRFRGHNNGRLFLSHRDAAKSLNCGRDTVAGYFHELEGRGFIAVTKGHCLGSAGVGQATHYRLTEEACDGKPATKEFMNWRPQKKQKPRRKNRHPMAGKSGTPCRKTRHSKNQMSENPTAFGQNQASAVSENPAISTSSHMYAEVQRCWERGLGLCGRATPKEAQLSKARSIRRNEDLRIVRA